jgi:hypothetical protein
MLLFVNTLENTVSLFVNPTASIDSIKALVYEKQGCGFFKSHKIDTQVTQMNFQDPNRGTT